MELIEDTPDAEARVRALLCCAHHALSDARPLGLLLAHPEHAQRLDQICQDVQKLLEDLFPGQSLELQPPSAPP